MLWGRPAAGLPAELPARALIEGVNGHAQSFTLSCESRSAVDWAAYWGISIRERKFLNSLPRSDNPDEGFVGDPNGVWGNIPPASYGVHAKPVAKQLREFGLPAEAYKDLTWDDLRLEIANGRPVIVWVIGDIWPGKAVRYKSKDGQTTRVAAHEHTMIMVGYAASTVTLVDAYSGKTKVYPKRSFLNSWAVLGNMAITGRSPTKPDDKPVPLNARVFLPLVVTSQAEARPVVNQQAELPANPPKTYKVKRGETLAGIARRYGLDWNKLAEINQIGYPYVIYTGQVLKLIDK